MASGKISSTASSVVAKISLCFHLVIFLCGRCIVECLQNLIYFLSCRCAPIRRRAQLPESLHGKTILITGANGGIGAELTRVCARLGATVILACRDAVLANETIERVLQSEPTVSAGQLTYVHLDLASLASVRRAVEELSRFPAIHVLFNNAGVMMCPRWRTEDGLEYQFGVNYLGHWLLTVLLMEKLNAGTARVVNFSSIALWVGSRHYFENVNLDGPWTYNSLVAYGRSKQFVMMATAELSRRLAARGSKVTVYSLHPGIVDTKLTRHLSVVLRALIWPLRPLFTISPLMGAQTALFCAYGDQARPGLYHA